VGKLLVHQIVSADGFAADADGRFRMFGQDAATPDFDRDLIARLADVEAVLLGGRTYEIFAEFWPTPAASDQLAAPAINAMPKIVFSTSLREAPWGEFPDARIEAGDPATAVRELKSAASADLLVWGSLTLTDALFAAGLVDVVRLAVLPVAIGAGRGWYPAGPGRLQLRLLDTAEFDDGIVASEYELTAHPAG